MPDPTSQHNEYERQKKEALRAQGYSHAEGKLCKPSLYGKTGNSRELGSVSSTIVRTFHTRQLLRQANSSVAAEKTKWELPKHQEIDKQTLYPASHINTYLERPETAL
jgi:hypothetical protein